MDWSAMLISAEAERGTTVHEIPGECSTLELQPTPLQGCWWAAFAWNGLALILCWNGAEEWTKKTSGRRYCKRYGIGTNAFVRVATITCIREEHLRDGSIAGCKIRCVRKTLRIAHGSLSVDSPGTIRMFPIDSETYCWSLPGGQQILPNN
jgi:hypothetical protein